MVFAVCICILMEYTESSLNIEDGHYKITMEKSFTITDLKNNVASLMTDFADMVKDETVKTDIRRNMPTLVNNIAAATNRHIAYTYDDSYKNILEKKYDEHERQCFSVSIRRI